MPLRFPHLRLRTALPLLFGGLMLLGVTVRVFVLHEQNLRRVRSRHADILRVEANALRNALSDLLVQGRSDLAERRFMDALLDHRVQALVLVDEAGTVRLSSRREWIGRAAREIEAFRAGDGDRALEMARDLQVATLDGGFAAYLPVDLGLRPGTLRTSKRGLLLVRYDLSHELADARHQSLIEGSWVLGLWTLMALLLWGLLDRLVTRKVDRLVRILGRVEAGNLDARTRLQGGNELDHLGATFDHLLDRIGEAHKELRQSNAFLDTILESIPLMVFVKDAQDLRFVRFNRAGERLLGWDRADLIGKSDRELFPPEQAEFFIQKDRAVLEGGEPLEIPEEPLQTRHQGQRILHTIKVPILDADGKPRYLSGISEDITERIRVEAALREGEARFRRMVMAAPVPIGVFHPSGRVEFVNPGFTALFGYSAEDLATLEDWWRCAYPDPEVRSFARRRWMEVAEKAHGSDGRIRLDRVEEVACKDGRRRIVEIHGVWLKDVALVVFNDLTERVEDEQRVRDALEFNEKLLATMAVGAVAFHGDSGRCVLANEAALQIIGGSLDYMLAQNFRQIPQWQETELLEASEKVLATGEDRHVDVRVRTRAGRDCHLSCHLSTFHSGGEPHLLVLIVDITDREQAEEDRRRLEQQMAQVGRLESLGHLAGGVAHDMNNVLAAIMALASLHGEQAPEGSALRKGMDTITRACVRGGTLVKGLLGFARESLAEERTLDLNALVREEVTLLERTTLQKVRLQTDLAEDLQAVKGDPAALSHALMNLCVNAVDAMPEGGTLAIRTRNEGPQVILEVADTGCGMSPEVLEKAMDPFFTTKPQGKGTGLGLSMVFGTIKAHRGQVQIHSVPGEGTTVALHLPASMPVADAPIGPEPEADPPRALRILLVDDDELIHQSTGLLLGMLGHAVTPARSGEEALNLLGAGQPLDLVILDMNMPGLGGAGTLPRLRTLRPDLPVLLATGRADQEAMDLAAGTPGTTLLPKPFSLKDLKAHLALFERGPR